MLFHTKIILATFLIFQLINLTSAKDSNNTFNPDDPCGTGKPRVTDTERLIKDVVSWIIMAALLFVSFTLGCGTNFEVLKDVFKRPVGLILGVICQFGIMPAFGYFLTYIQNVNN